MGKHQKQDGIAIVGMSCVFPGALNPEELWTNVLAGRRFFRTFPDERLSREDYYDPDPNAPGKAYTDKIAVIDGWSFDPLEYRIPPVTAYGADIVHWLALDTARRALKDSGISLDQIDLAHTGVVIGNSLGGEFGRSHYLRFRWPYMARSIRRALQHSGADEQYIESVITSVRAVYESPLPEINEDSLAGNMSNTIAGRICNYFDFGAGGYTVDGACSSSLLAIAKACDALMNGEMTVALAGGVDVSLDAFEVVGFSKTRALSRDDIRPYDKHADGMFTGEGCGIFVLMRAEDAKKAGFTARALIRGWGISSDGAGALTAPEVKGQLRALRSAYQRAGYTIGTVGLLEGHGTGTPIGDKVELTAIRALIEEAPGETPCAIGSIKANIGHCKAAAGSAGLIKSIMALERKILPPTLNCESPNPVFNGAENVLRPSTRGVVWKRGTHPRRASVSAMGFGGINTHVTLEEANPQDEQRAGDLELLRSYRRTELIALSGTSTQDILSQVNKLLLLAGRLCRAELTDVAAALAADEPKGSMRIALVVDSPWRLRDLLEQVSHVLTETSDLKACHNPAEGIFAGIARENPRFVALFPGQGSQFLNMGAAFMRAYPQTEAFLHEADRDIRTILPDGMLSRMIYEEYADDAKRACCAETLAQTEIAQPAITAVSVAILSLLTDVGLSPAAVLGHSLGEITALHAAGAYDGKTAVRIAAARGKAIAELKCDQGGMTAVKAAPEKIEALMAEIDGYLTIANYNSPQQTIIAGTNSALEAFEAQCSVNGISCQRLDVSHAFHSNLVAPATDTFRAALKMFDIGEPGLPLVSSITGMQLEPGEDIHRLLIGQITSSVRFVEAAWTAQALHPDMWIEIGPGGVLCNLIRAVCGQESACFTTNLAGEDAHTQVHRVVANAFVLGFPVKLSRLFAHRYTKPFSISNYSPKFIVNPCERPLSADIPAITGNGISASIKMPNGVEPAYLRSREAYLREMIELDYRHWKTDGADEPAAAPAGLHESKSDNATETFSVESMIDYAIEWISQRTGFPRSAIQPEMKLRDDLNLDSIKVGELVYNVSRKLKKQVPADPSGYANAQLATLINVIQNDFKDIEESQPISTITSVTGAPAIPSLGEWIRTFQIENVPAPLSAEMFSRLPTRGKLYVVGEPACDRIQTFIRHMTRHGLQPVVIDSAALNEETPSPTDIAMLVCILPETQQPIMSCSPAEFDMRTDGNVKHLFNIFKWAGGNLDPSWTNLRCVVARPYCVPDNAARETVLPHSFNQDMDAGKAFLKTLQREYTAFWPKWLAIPASLSPEQWGNLIEKELQTTGRRVYYAYASDGTRYTQAAMPISMKGGNGLELNSHDVILCTGGARGITFELARGLARKTGAAIALIGRTPMPVVDDTTSELSRNFKVLEQEGINYLYAQTDVNDREALQAVVTRIEAEKGHITGILHGAGTTDLNLFREITLDQFLNTFRVKVHGLYNLLAVVPISQLKMIHALSSVLGHTGMAGQSDYTMANAWLDGTIRELHVTHPELHCLSLGYTIWSETGLGKKLGAVESLHSSGTVPVNTRDGVKGYLALSEQSLPEPSCIITGRLNDDLDPNLYPLPPPARYRFLQRIMRYMPQTECVAEAVLEHATDWYLPEHVFQGTPLFPGVMALEAMTEVAQYCLGRTDLPVFENVQFLRAVIVPDDGRVTLRTLVLAEPPCSGVTRVKAALCVDTDNYQAHHLTAEMVFGESRDVPAIPMPSLNGDIGRHPEEFCPHPLFQGKFFRRISAIRKIVYEEEVLCNVTIPDSERYYSGDLPRDTAMPSPAARDAFLHSGILALPPHSLPKRIERICVYAEPQPHDTVVCYGRVIDKTSDGEHRSDMLVFDANGTILETIEGVITVVPPGLIDIQGSAAARPVPLERISSDLAGLIPDVPHAFGSAKFDECEAASEIRDSDRQQLAAFSEHRRNALLTGLLAARRAAVSFISKYAGIPLEPHMVMLEHTPVGAPLLVVTDDTAASHFADVTVSFADTGEYAVALIAPGPAGIDIEPVDCRDAETWRALLSDDGYTQAICMARETNESFDCAATRIWALLEASKKAHNLKRVLPLYDTPRGSSWHSSSSVVDGARVENLSAIASAGNSMPCAVVAVTLPSEQSPVAGKRAVLNEFAATLDEFTHRLRELQTACVNDPDAHDAVVRREQIVDCVQNAIRRLQAVEGAVEPSVLYDLRKQAMARLREFADGTEVVSHSIDKPYGYIGDFMMLEKLLQNSTNATGLAYQLDTIQLGHPASAACRNRVTWVVDTLTPKITQRETATIKILDIGIGSAPVERTLLENIPELALSLTAIDIEPAALAFVEQKLKGRAFELNLRRIDLRAEDAGYQLAALAGDIDACIAIGIVEALRDEEIVNVFSSLFEALPHDALVFVESFIPDHPTRPYMEWFMDYHLGYRTTKQVVELMIRAGADPARITTSVEATGSLGFVIIHV